MTMTNRVWLPEYSNPNAFQPKIQETRSLFSHPPYLFQVFVAKAIRFLQSDKAKKMGFDYVASQTLPCKWLCSDESLFGATLSIFAYSGQYPFEKGAIGSNFNQSSVGAAVHHGRINIDFGGSHTGYIPGKDGGRFGKIWRPLHNELSADCGHLMGIMDPFKTIYDDACQNIQIFSPDWEKLMISVPNEFVQPSWSSQNVKLLIDTDTLTTGDIPYNLHLPHTHTAIGRTLFQLNPKFLIDLPQHEAKAYLQPKPTPIGHNLTYKYFNIFDINATLNEYGRPVERINLYAKYILSARHSPFPLKAAIVNTNLEYNKLTDTVRSIDFKPYCFASFTGVFIDLFYEPINNYVNLFQPLGISIKPAGATHCVELMPEQIYKIFDELKPVKPKQLPGKMGELTDHQKVMDLFTYKPV